MTNILSQDIQVANSTSFDVELFIKNQTQVFKFFSLWKIYGFVTKRGWDLPIALRECNICHDKIKEKEKVLIVWADSDIYLNSDTEISPELFIFCEHCTNENMETDLEELVSLVKVQYKEIVPESALRKEVNL